MKNIFANILAMIVISNVHAQIAEVNTYPILGTVTLASFSSYLKENKISQPKNYIPAEVLVEVIQASKDSKLDQSQVNAILTEYLATQEKNTLNLTYAYALEWAFQKNSPELLKEFSHKLNETAKDDGISFSSATFLCNQVVKKYFDFIYGSIDPPENRTRVELLLSSMPSTTRLEDVQCKTIYPLNRNLTSQKVNLGEALKYFSPTGYAKYIERQKNDLYKPKIDSANRIANVPEKLQNRCTVQDIQKILFLEQSKLAGNKMHTFGNQLNDCKIVGTLIKDLYEYRLVLHFSGFDSEEFVDTDLTRKAQNILRYFSNTK